MHWCRTRLRLGSYIALFALAVQLVLTFGHVHLGGVGRQSSTGIVAPAGTAAPAGYEGPKIADDFCAVCTLIHLASTIVPTEVAALPLPVVFGQLRRTDSALHLVLPASPPAPFAARAPPLA
jgi:hypothetical protein